MGNVWEAMKKHQDEQAEQDAASTALFEDKEDRALEHADLETDRNEDIEQMKTDRNQTDTDIHFDEIKDSFREQLDKSDEISAKHGSIIDRVFGEISSLLSDIKSVFAGNDPAVVLDEASQHEQDSVEQDKHYSKLLVSHHNRGGQISEEYRALRTSLLAQSPDERFCYLITSAEPGEGKTLTCLNLALIMAERHDRRTLVVDANLRNNKMASYLKAADAPGLVDVIRGTASLDDVVQPTIYPNLFFLPAGQVDPDQIGELLVRSDVKDIADTLRDQYDYVFFDSPPLTSVSDAATTARAIGQVLLVARMNKTDRDSTQRAIRLLNAANVKPAGIVLTHWKQSIPNFLIDDQ